MLPGVSVVRPGACIVHNGAVEAPLTLEVILGAERVANLQRPSNG